MTPDLHSAKRTELCCRPSSYSFPNILRVRQSTGCTKQVHLLRQPSPNAEKPWIFITCPKINAFLMQKRRPKPTVHIDEAIKRKPSDSKPCLLTCWVIGSSLASGPPKDPLRGRRTRFPFVPSPSINITLIIISVALWIFLFFFLAHAESPCKHFFLCLLLRHFQRFNERFIVYFYALARR